MLRTPLVVRARDVPVGTFHTRVRVIDLHPTLLDLAAGIVMDGPGKHLEAVWARRETSDRDVFARTSYKSWSLRAALVGRYKLVDDVRTGQRALYDLGASGEDTDILDARPELAADLLRRMGRTWDAAINDEALRFRVRFQR